MLWLVRFRGMRIKGRPSSALCGWPPLPRDELLALLPLLLLLPLLILLPDRALALSSLGPSPDCDDCDDGGGVGDSDSAMPRRSLAKSLPPLLNPFFPKEAGEEDNEEDVSLDTRSDCFSKRRLLVISAACLATCPFLDAADCVMSIPTSCV